MTKSNQKVLIIAAGDGSRWGNYLGVPKHLVNIEGEILLNRTCRQFLRYSSDVVVVGPDDRYSVQGTKLFIPDMSERRELDKFASSMSEWNEQGKTILVYGDVYFTDEAVEAIVSHVGDWRYFCRSKASSITGKNCKEIFAISFDSADLKLFKKAITRANQIDKENIIQAFKEGNLYHGWALKHEPEQYYNKTYKKDK
jgi:hypothetical protein